MGYAAASKAAKSGRPGTGVIEVSLSVLKSILTNGWSTGNRALRCTAGIPEDAQFWAVTLVRPDRFRLYFRSRDLPDIVGATPIVCNWGEIDIQVVTVGACLQMIMDQLKAVPVKPRRGRPGFQWLDGGKVKAEDAAIDGLRGGLMAVMQSIERTFPEASSAAYAILAAEAEASRKKAEADPATSEESAPSAPAPENVSSEQQRG
jgi:hypothetical protein